MGIGTILKKNHGCLKRCGPLEGKNKDVIIQEQVSNANSTRIDICCWRLQVVASCATTWLFSEPNLC